MRGLASDQLAQQLESACSDGNYLLALSLYKEAIRLDPENAILYSNRSAIHCKALHRKAYALRCLKRFEESIIIYAKSLMSYPENLQLKTGLVECLTECPSTRNYQFSRNPSDIKLNVEFLRNLARRFLDTNDQETGTLLLELCLEFDILDLNDLVNICEILTSVYASRGSLERIAQLLTKCIEISKNAGNFDHQMRFYQKLADLHSENCRFEDALSIYNHILSFDDIFFQHRASILMAMGRIYEALHDSDISLQYYQQTLEFSIKSLSNDRSLRVFTLIYDCLTNIGDLHLKMGNFDEAEDVFLRKLTISIDELKDVEKQCLSLISLGLMHLKADNFEKSRRLFLDAFRTSQSCPNKERIEVKLCGYLASVNTEMKKFNIARRWAEKELHLALSDKNVVHIAEACGILGLIEFSSGFKDNAMKLFQRQFDLAKEIDDKQALATAYGNLAKLSSNMEAIVFNTKRLEISKEMNSINDQLNCLAEVALSALEIYIEKRYTADDQTLKYFDIAENHIKCYINFARSYFHLDENDRKSHCVEMKVFRNCGLFYQKASILPVALDFFERFLMAAQECGHLAMEKLACSLLGNVHKMSGQLREAARYFRQELSLAKELRDHVSMTECYRNLCLVHIEASDSDESTECAKYFTALAQIVGSQSSKLEALRLMGDTLRDRRKFSLAFKLYAKYLKLARNAASSIESETNKQEDATYHQCLAYGRLGSTFDNLGNRKRAKLCFEVQFSIAKERNDLCLLFDSVCRLFDHYESSGDIQLQENILLSFLRECKIRNNIVFESKILKMLGDFTSRRSPKSLVFDRNTDKFFCARVSILQKYSKIELYRNTQMCSLFKDALFAYTTFLIKNRQFSRCLTILEKNFDGLAMSNESSLVILLKIAQLRFTLGYFERSAFLYELILFHSSNFDVDVLRECEIYLNLAACYFRSKNIELCRKNLEIGLNIAEKRGFFELQCKIYLSLSKFEENYLERAIKVAKEKNMKSMLCEIYSLLSNYGSNSDYLHKASRFVCDDKSQFAYLKIQAYCSLDEMDLRTCVVLAENIAMNSSLEMRLVLSIVLWSKNQFQELARLIDDCFQISKDFDLGFDSFYDFFSLNTEYMRSLPILSCILGLLFYLERDEAKFSECIEQLLYENEIKEMRDKEYPLCRAKLSETQISMDRNILIHLAIEKWLFVFSKESTIKLINVLELDDSDENYPFYIFECHFPNENLKAMARKLIYQSIRDFINSPISAKHHFQQLAENSERLLFAGLRTPLEFTAIYHVGFDILSDNRSGPMKKFLFIDCDFIYHKMQISVRHSRYISSKTLASEILRTKCQFLYSPFWDDDYFQNDQGPKITYEKLFKLQMNCEFIFIFDDRNSLTKEVVFALAKKFQMCGCKNVVFFLKFNIIKSKLIEFFDVFAENQEGHDYSESLKIALSVLGIGLDDLIIFGNMSQGMPITTEDTNPYRLLLKTPDECRKAMLVVLHLVEKSLLCLKSGGNRRFTDESSIKNKIGPEVCGVFQLLGRLGFERRSCLPKYERMWYFPEKGCYDILEKASERLLSFLNLPHIFYVALAKLFNDSVDSREEIFFILRKISDDLRHISNAQYEIRVEKSLYEDVAGVAELFAALGLDRIDSRKDINILRTKRLELTRTKLQHTLCCIEALSEKFNDFDEILYGTADVPRIESLSKSLIMNNPVPLNQNSTNNDININSASVKKLSTLKKSNARKYATMHRVRSKKQQNYNDGYKSDAEVNNREICENKRTDYSSLNENSKRQRLSSTNNLNAEVLDGGDCYENTDDEVFHSVREALEKFRLSKSQKRHEYARLETPSPRSDNDYVQPMPDENYGNFRTDNTVEYCSTAVFGGKYNVREANENFNLDVSDTQVHLDLV